MNIYILNTLGIGYDLISLLTGKIPIAGIIGLSDRESTDTISDFVYQYDFCKANNLSFIQMETYSLSSENDKKILRSLDIDILIVSGWQRLVPDWLIRHCNICAIGSHGSPLGITKGRGRSPQNWALLLGLDTFQISIFKIDPGVDSGPVIDTRSFNYSVYDNIKTSYYKTCLLTAEMLVKNLQDPEFIHRDFEVQNSEEAEYFPQRLPADGKIDWTRSSADIYNFVRALTKPYPGAESSVNGHTVKIWSALPFDLEIGNNFPPGRIVKIFSKNDILVKTKDGFILIDDYRCDDADLKLTEGMDFESEPFGLQIDRIVERHEAKYPELPVSKLILSNRNSL